MKLIHVSYITIWNKITKKTSIVYVAKLFVNKNKRDDNTHKKQNIQQQQQKTYKADFCFELEETVTSFVKCCKVNKYYLKIIIF